MTGHAQVMGKRVGKKSAHPGFFFHEPFQDEGKGPTLQIQKRFATKNPESESTSLLKEDG